MGPANDKVGAGISQFQNSRVKKEPPEPILKRQFTERLPLRDDPLVVEHNVVSIDLVDKPLAG